MDGLKLDLVKIAQQNSAQYKRQQQASIIETNEDVEKTIEALDKAELKKIQQNFYQKSIQDSGETKKQEIHGKNYVMKNLPKRILYIAVVIAGAILIGKAIKTGSEISYFNNILDKKIEAELTDEQIEHYQEEHKNPISNMIEAYKEIQMGNDSLNSNNYNLHGNNISEHDNDYLPFDEDGLYNLSHFQQDAIDIATDNVIEEYQRRGM